MTTTTAPAGRFDGPTPGLQEQPAKAPKSAANLAAQAEYERAAQALFQAQTDHLCREVTDAQLAAYQAVYDMAEAKYMICAYSDKLIEATARHTEAIKALNA